MMPGGLQGDSGQLAAQVRFMERDGNAAVLVSVAEQPPQGHLVGGSTEHQGLGNEIRVPEGELDGSVRGLHGLRAGGKVGAGDEVEPGYLRVIHTFRVTHRQCLMASRMPNTALRMTASAAIAALTVARIPAAPP